MRAPANKNMFLAIINDTYSEVKEELSNQENELQFSDILKQSYNRTLFKLKLKKERISDVQKALQNGTKELGFADFKNSLKELGHADHEITAAFSRFDHDGNQILDEDEQRKMKRDLEERRVALNEEIEHLGRSCGNNYLEEGRSTDELKNCNSGQNNFVSYNDFKMLVSRVLQLDYSVGVIASKMDSIVNTLMLLEGTKLKQKGMMGELLDNISEEEMLNQEELLHRNLDQLVKEEQEGWETDYLKSNLGDTAYGITKILYSNVSNGPDDAKINARFPFKTNF